MPVPYDQQEVLVSAFFIDRFPVTNRRYLECVEAGVCIERSYDRLSFLREPVRADHPFMGAYRRDAWTFCRWDGGRRLPTSYEWGKAARGPAPRMNEFVWDSEPPCVDLPTYSCDPSYQDGPRPGFDFDVDELPATASYYGVELLVAGGLEHVLDTAVSTDVVADDANFSAAILDEGLFRGHALLARLAASRMYLADVKFPGRSSTEPRGAWTFRCARSDEGAEREWEAELPRR